ncbi:MULTISPECIES: preprotein translocase subunit YajC [Sanguibacter]|jgi:preprotein translocase subunit YajC|uniref:Preprotein translocase subunit YajC n=2 Tax=Sanguibacter TaxID=60919 RepID=A0A853ERX6_9MICO|nr:MULTISPECIES: preprotein translocase subunit YajC [Sanguibacter]KQT98154.1 preprotein translocase subunit YajC [Sanguibacter sp. Leaf3]MBF0722174.1 preprotein translocase subunit YajC [Sanguibacter inulinus]NYS93319.1 preprotein translocase subunit YajC [Sanguibacter inulinus]WPF83985.1 preprotein translocase subunit YajC [Sanguibacter sp. 4.1]
MTTIFILVLAAVAMVFMTRSSRKRQKEAMSFRDNLAVGQEVMTGSGYFGRIVAVEDDAITLETTPGNTSRWLRAAIAKLVDPPADAVVVEGSSAEAAAQIDAENARAFDIPEDISSLIDKKKTDENGK